MNCDYKSVAFQHANLNRVVNILLGQIVAYHYSEAQKSVVVYAAGGALFPVKESMDEVKVKINNAAKTAEEA